MDMYSNHTSKLYSIIENLFVIFSILQCSSIYLYSDIIPFSKVLITGSCQLFIIILFFLSLNKLNNYKCGNLFLFSLILIIFSIVIIIYNLIINNNSFHILYAFKLFIDPIMLITFFYSLNNIKQMNRIFIKFDNFVFYLAIISLFFCILRFLQIPMTSNVPLIGWGPRGVYHTITGYFDINFFTEPNNNMSMSNLTDVRNSGIFVEPSMFSYVLIFSLLVELFMKHNDKVINCRTIVFLFAILTTESTTGIIISFVALIYCMLLSSKLHLSKLLFISIIPFIVFFLILVLSNKISGSLDNSDASYLASSSAAIRFDDIKTGWLTWLTHPFLGVGLGANVPLKMHMSSWRFLNKNFLSDSAGFTTVLAQCGAIYVLIYYLLPSIIVSKWSNRFLGIAISLLIVFIFVTCQGFFIYIALLSYFWAIIFKHFEQYYLY